MKEILELADRLKAAREGKRTIEDGLKETNGLIEKLERELSELMLNEEVPNFSRNGSTYYLSTKTYASPAAGRKDELYNWLRGNGYGDLVKETVYSQTLSSFVKELLEESDELPEGLKDVVNVFEKTSVNMRKSK